MSTRSNLHVLLLALLATGIACAQPASPTLRSVYQDDFLIGAALPRTQVNGENPNAAKIAARQFSSITAENDMKWERIHPQPDRYDFKNADAYVEFARRNQMVLIGHTLVWHSQTPDWVFKGKGGRIATRAELLARMKDHIDTVAGRYKGKVRGWDVVNEAISDGPGGLRDTPWRRIIGDDFIDQAFRFAKAADPHAELYYNDYLLEDRDKRARTIAMLKGLIKRGVPIDGVGMQCHLGLKTPTIRELDRAIRDFTALGLKVMITELDVDVLPSKGEIGIADISRVEESDPKLNPYTRGLPDDVQQQLAERYAALFRLFLQHKKNITRVTFWGLDDGHTWLNHFPISGRTNHPLLIDRKLLPKPAFFAVLKVGVQNERKPLIKSDEHP